MAATFRPVNGEVTRDDTSMTVSPTTPTPTKATFGQRPLPTSPFPQAVQIPESIEEATPQRENSQHSTRKSTGDSEDVDMDESEGEGRAEDGAGSDDDSVDADGNKSNKKKKSQRFYCTDYPPCSLSFTRSEHLARHIRKHTGERPFQCHCSRRFSRLDNLRQHAQTVHVNEDIPIDSLAATGTRFQRQIRTDRVRPSGRARASTAGSMGAASRGHGKSLSTSSISSIGSSYSVREDARRRPTPLVMADPRARLSFESHHSAADSQYSYRGPSPSDFSTPTSATFSTVQSSPRWNSSIASPTSSHSRSQSLYAPTRASCRRLSVPSGGNPFQSNVGAILGRSLFVPGSMNSSNTGAYSPTPSSVASPTSSMFSRRESNDESWRRRTWHPDSSNFNNPNTSSRLSNVITPSQFPSPSSGSLPIANPATQTTSLRLPGIESFDPLPHRPATPARQQSSPMSSNSEMSRPSILLPATGMTEDRRSAPQWDLGLHRGLTRLDINSSSTPTRDGAGAWAQEVHRAVEAQANLARLHQPVVRFNDSITMENRGPSMGNRALHQHTMSAPLIPSNTERKRYGAARTHGAIAVHSDAPPEKMLRVERMIHPNISEFSMARQQMAPKQSPRAESNNRDSMLRLDALVAVATNENAATTAY